MSGVKRGEWTGLVAGTRADAARSDRIVELAMPLQESRTGVSGTFLGLGVDGRRWWVKPPAQRELEQALVTEFIVAELGRLIDAPTCRNAIIRIPEDLIGWEFRPGKCLVAGLGHGTLHVEDAIEKRSHLEDRARDDNQARHAGIFALYDWCWGDDAQWLHCISDDMATYSHDHGWYLPPPGPGWDQRALELDVDTPHPLNQSASGLSGTALDGLACRLERVARKDIQAILCQVPEEWPVDDSDLECLGWFLEKRAPEVALRIRRLAPGSGD